jgi:hypothetical protein
MAELTTGIAKKHTARSCSLLMRASSSCTRSYSFSMTASSAITAFRLSDIHLFFSAIMPFSNFFWSLTAYKRRNAECDSTLKKFRETGPHLLK